MCIAIISGQGDDSRLAWQAKWNWSDTDPRKFGLWTKKYKLPKEEKFPKVNCLQTTNELTGTLNDPSWEPPEAPPSGQPRAPLSGPPVSLFHYNRWNG